MLFDTWKYLSDLSQQLFATKIIQIKLHFGYKEFVKIKKSKLSGLNVHTKVGFVKVYLGANKESPYLICHVTNKHRYSVAKS